MANGRWPMADGRWRIPGGLLSAISHKLSARGGQAWAGGVMLVVILILAAAVLADVYHLHQVRNFAYGLAADAALAGANQGRDFVGYYSSQRGRLGLASSAYATALDVVAEGMSERGITGYEVIIQVISDSNGGEVQNFPPVPRAGLAGESHWTTSGPAVGVYLAVPVPTNLFGLVNGGQPFTVHAFHAAEVVRVQT